MKMKNTSASSKYFSIIIDAFIDNPKFRLRIVVFISIHKHFIQRSIQNMKIYCFQYEIYLISTL